MMSGMCLALGRSRCSPDLATSTERGQDSWASCSHLGGGVRTPKCNEGGGLEFCREVSWEGGTTPPPTATVER